jgi:cysteine desulfurase
MAIRGVLDANPQKRHIITTRVEHPAVLNLCQHLAKDGYRLTEIGVDHQGNLDIDELDRAITDDTAIVSVMWANNETGVVFPIDRIAAMVRARGVVFHCDAVQAAGKIPVNLRQTPIDLLSIAGHKIHAPKGVGVLYVRRGTKIRPLMIGGHQERGRRPGTENTASIIGLGKACELAGAHIEDYETRVRAMRDRLEEQALATCPDSMVNGDREARVPNTTNLGFEYVEGEAILLLLNETGICASSGSACTSGSLEPSHVLRAMGVPFTCSHGSVRFSLSRYTTEAEIDHTLKHLPPVIQRLREISPFTPRPAVR